MTPSAKSHTSTPPSPVQNPQNPAGGRKAVPSNTVSITDAGYSPPELALKVGDTVSFVNDGTRTHNVSFDEVASMSQDVAVGETFAHTVTAPGDHKYHCKDHPEMKGVLKVGEK